MHKSKIKWIACNAWQLKATEQEARESYEKWIERKGVAGKETFGVLPVYVGSLESVKEEEGWVKYDSIHDVCPDDIVKLRVPTLEEFSVEMPVFNDAWTPEMTFIVGQGGVHKVSANSADGKIVLIGNSYNWPLCALLHK